MKESFQIFKRKLLLLVKSKSLNSDYGARKVNGICILPDRPSFPQNENVHFPNYTTWGQHSADLAFHSALPPDAADG